MASNDNDSANDSGYDGSSVPDMIPEWMTATPSHPTSPDYDRALGIDRLTDSERAEMDAELAEFRRDFMEAIDELVEAWEADENDGMSKDQALLASIATFSKQMADPGFAMHLSIMLGCAVEKLIHLRRGGSF